MQQVILPSADGDDFWKVARARLGIAKPEDARDAAGGARRHGCIGKMMLDEITKGSGVAQTRRRPAPDLSSVTMPESDNGASVTDFPAARGTGDRAGFQQARELNPFCS